MYMSSPRAVCMVMEPESPSKLKGRSSSVPARPPPAIAADSSSSSITRPYRLSPSTTKPSALLQRRERAHQGLTEVKAFIPGTTESEPAPAATTSPASCKPPSAYEVLQIPLSATQQEIKTAYWRLARQFHPDKAPFEHKEASTLRFLQIHSAYMALKDPQARARYDLEMSFQSSQGSLADPKTPHFCSPSPNLFNGRSQVYTPKGANPYTPRSQFYTPNSASPYMPRSQVNTPRGAPSAAASPDSFTPRTPYSTGRSWETDQCW
eukprot:c17116_g1_i1 orf=153-947(+)